MKGVHGHHLNPENIFDKDFWIMKEVQLHHLNLEGIFDENF
jgi:hypothetical protein